MPLPRPPRLLAFVSILVFADAARAAIEFVGVLATPERTLFALSDTETNRNAWVAVGKPFGGYTVARFDGATETLTLTQRGTETQLHLKPDAKVQPARFEVHGTVTFSQNEKLEVVRATLQFDQENVLPLKEGLVCRLTPSRRTDGTILYRAAFERTMADGKKETLTVPSVVALAGQAFGIHVGDIGFSFKP